MKFNLCHNNCDIVSFPAKMLISWQLVINCRLSVWRVNFWLVSLEFCKCSYTVRLIVKSSVVLSETSFDVRIEQIVENSVGTHYYNVVMLDAMLFRLCFFAGNLAVGSTLEGEVKTVGLFLRPVDCLVLSLWPDYQVSRVAQVASLHFVSVYLGHDCCGTAFMGILGYRLVKDRYKSLARVI